MIGAFRKAFAKLERRHKSHMGQWKAALYEAANMSGWPLSDDSCVQDIDKLLDMEKSNVRIVGIRGIGGIGKITFAKAMFNSSRLKFKSSCFLTDVTSTSMPHRGLSQLQETHLFDILGDSDLKVSDCNV